MEMCWGLAWNENKFITELSNVWLWNIYWKISDRTGYGHVYSGEDEKKADNTFLLSLSMNSHPVVSHKKSNKKELYK